MLKYGSLILVSSFGNGAFIHMALCSISNNKSSSGNHNQVMINTRVWLNSRHIWCHCCGTLQLSFSDIFSSSRERFQTSHCTRAHTIKSAIASVSHIDTNMKTHIKIHFIPEHIPILYLPMVLYFLYFHSNVYYDVEPG